MRPLIAGVGLAAAILGAVIMIGAARRWSWLVDPPDRVAGVPVWPYALLKQRVGPECVVRYHRLMGAGMILAGGFFMVLGLVR